MYQWESETSNGHQKSPISLLTRITLCRPVPISNTEGLLTYQAQKHLMKAFKRFLLAQ